MKKSLKLVILLLLGIVIVFIGLKVFYYNRELNKLIIIDATYRKDDSCDNIMTDKIYEDVKYVYYLKCSKKNSVYVKFPNNNKILVEKALEEGKVSIDNLIKSGLNVYKERK